MNYNIDVDSAEREDLNPNDFVFKLNRPLYNVSDFRLISANIPLTQSTINDGNNILVIDGTSYLLDNKFYSSGSVLAYDIEQSISGTSNVTSVTYDSNTMALTFSNVGSSNNFSLNLDSYSPFNILGFDLGNVFSSGGTLTGGVVDLHGPTNLLLRVTSGSDDLKKKVYRHEGQSIYTARILTSTANGMMTYKGSDDPVEYYFHEGKFKSIDRLRIRFYYINGSRLIPYDFGKRNLFLKFRVTCSLDKLEPLKDQDDQTPLGLPPPVELPSISLKNRFPIVIGVVLFIGLIVLIFLKPKPRIPAPMGS